MSPRLAGPERERRCRRCSGQEDVFVTGDDRGQSTGLSKRGRQQIWLRPIAPCKIEVLNQGRAGVAPARLRVVITGATSVQNRGESAPPLHRGPSDIQACIF